jgi:1,4-dihydroxy-2-naphthoate octaprenyltransferase
VAIGIAYAFLPISMGLFAGGSTYNTYINWLPLILFMSMVTFSYTIAKEYSDVFGDSKSGRKTLPLLLGKEKSIRAQFVFIALSYLFLIVLIASGYLKYTFLLALLSLVFEIYILINMRNTENQPKLVKFALYNKISHLFLRVLIVISFLV